MLKFYRWTNGTAIVRRQTGTRQTPVRTGRRGRPAYLGVEAAALRLPVCPLCHALWGEACRRPSGTTLSPHRSRLIASIRATAERVTA